MKKFVDPKTFAGLFEPLHLGASEIRFVETKPTAGENDNVVFDEFKQRYKGFDGL